MLGDDLTISYKRKHGGRSVYRSIENFGSKFELPEELYN